MKLKSIFIAAVAAVATALPAAAQPFKHAQLLQHLDNLGMTITVDDEFCVDHPGVLGAYITTHEPHIALCPGGHVDALDLSTVRHEVGHALQHCVNVKRGTPRDTPILPIDALSAKVNAIVPASDVVFIKSNYPRHKWLIEFEANYIERAYTPLQLLQLWNDGNCTEVLL